MFVKLPPFFDHNSDVFILISGDINYVSLNWTLCTITQFVDCSTKENKTLENKIHCEDSEGMVNGVCLKTTGSL